MPELCRFLGKIIIMRYREHMPPHFHSLGNRQRRAEYNGYKGAFTFDGVMTEGNIPTRQQKFIAAWCEFHSEELKENWELAREGKPLKKIKLLRLEF